MTAIDELIEKAEYHGWDVDATRAEVERLKAGGVVKFSVEDGLLPCPFCGGEASISSPGCTTYRRYFYEAGCQACGIYFVDPLIWSPHGLVLGHEKECPELWNTRFLPGADPEREERASRIETAAINAVLWWYAEPTAGLHEEIKNKMSFQGAMAELRAELEGKK